MCSEHETGKKRKLDAVGNDSLVETDEQLARRLHEELNALTRHSRRGTNAAVPSSGSCQRGGAKPAKGASAPDGKTAGKPKQQAKHADIKAEAAAGVAGEQHAAVKNDKPRKRSMLNRELAMLVTDMVEAHVKPVTGPRLKGKDEHDQQDQRQPQDDNHSAALKHESSSSLSEQERLAIEHLHAAGTVTKPVNKLLDAPHLAARTSDSGVAGGDSCTTGATSSGKACSSSHEHEQQQTSGQQCLQQQQQQQQVTSKQVQRSGAATSIEGAAAVAQSRSALASSTGDCAGGGGRPIKIPKLPMVQYGKKWYRAKVLKDAGSKVMLEYQGFSHEGGPFWLAKDHQRIWRGSYKGRDWRYLGDGAWEPKVTGKSDAKARAHRRGPHHHKRSSVEAVAASGAASDGTAADSDAELVQPHGKRKSVPRSAKRSVDAAAAGAASDTAASDRDTESTDQEDVDECAAALAEPLTVDSPAMPEPEPEPEQQPQLEQKPKQQQHTAPVKVQPEQSAQQQTQTQQRKEMEPSAQQSQEQQLKRQKPQPEQLVESDPVQQSSAKLQEQQQQQAQPMEVDSQPEREVRAEQQDVAATLPKQEALEELEQQSQEVQDQQQKAVDRQQLKLLEKQQSSSDKQQKAADRQQRSAEKSHHRRRRQSEADSETAASKAAVHDSPAAKSATKAASKTASEQAAAPAPASAVATESAAPAVAAAVGPSDSSTERDMGEAAAKSEAAAEKVEEAVSLPARSASTGRGRYSRKNKAAAAAAPSAAAAVHESAAPVHAAAAHATKAKRGGRGARSRSAATTQSQDSAPREDEQPQGSGSKGPSLQIDASKAAIKHSSSSEGLPTSPTSPVAGSGGSPRAHRRKGKPQRARLDSDDLQRPVKKIKAAQSCASAIDALDHPMLHELPELQAVQQPQQQPLQQQQEQQAQAPVSLGFKGAWKGAYKKGIWQHESQQPEQEQQSGSKPGVAAHRKSHQQQESWGEQQQQVAAGTSVAVGEGHMQSEQPHVLGGSDPEDLEAACVLIGASMGRAHSGEVFGMYDSMQQHSRAAEVGFSSHLHRAYSAGCDDQLSPRGFASTHGRQNGRRRGHNWSKPLNNRPPRPPPMQQQQQQGLQHGNAVPRRHSLNGSSSQQQVEVQHAHSASQEMPAGMPNGISRQASLDPAVCSQQHQKRRNGSCLLFGNDSNSKAATLRALLDAVGEVQATSGRPDLMYPLQYGGLPIGTSEPARPCAASLQHVHMSAAATALLSAVPTLETLHQMAVQGQAGLAACLNGCAPSLFQ